MDANRLYQDLHASTERTIIAILRRTAYRNAGAIPTIEHPVQDMMEAVNFRALSNAEQEQLIQVVLGMFRNINYPGKGTMQAIEQPIYTMISAIENSLTQTVTRAATR